MRGLDLAAVRTDRRGRPVEPVAAMDPVHPLAELRGQGRNVPHRRRLLRLPPAVSHQRRAVAVRLADHHPAHHAGGRLPERRHPAPEPAAAGHAAGQGARVGDPGRARAGQGGRLLPVALPAHGLDPRLRAGRDLRRRARVAARARAAAVHRPAVVRPVHLQHLAAGLGAARGGGGPVGARGHHRRHGLPRVHRGRAGQAERVDARSPVHQEQHHRRRVRPWV